MSQVGRLGLLNQVGVAIVFSQIQPGLYGVGVILDHDIGFEGDVIAVQLIVNQRLVHQCPVVVLLLFYCGPTMLWVCMVSIAVMAKAASGMLLLISVSSRARRV